MTHADSDSASRPEVGEPLDERGLKILADVAGYLAAGLGSEEVLIRVAGVLARGLGADHCHIWVRAANGTAYRAIVGEDRFDLREFHTTLLLSGNMPVALMRSEMLEHARVLARQN